MYSGILELKIVNQNMITTPVVAVITNSTVAIGEIPYSKAFDKAVYKLKKQLNKITNNGVDNVSFKSCTLSSMIMKFLATSVQFGERKFNSTIFKSLLN
ncbi:hypothetical protein NPIL_616661 [Nephila pilipes]|uniref:Uncharacterized protein n=1 Tax=Nephila pilipes TaxID=299642 RepID=A0A8X6P5Y0_NEPPI|nr:hypothetical protein NPIL_616661 [Nephila pilipes]